MSFPVRSLLASLLCLSACGDSSAMVDAATDASSDAPSIDALALDSSADAVAPDSSAFDGAPADSGIADVGADAGTDVDPTRTTSVAALERSADYEAQFWAAREPFMEGLRGSLPDPSRTDLAAQASSYSSSIGLGIYHALDEVVGLANVLEAAADPAHREWYAAAAAELIDIMLPAIVNAEGTETCTGSASDIYRCSPGNFRYLDAGHGLGGIGFLMNAIYEDASLRAEYSDRLRGWAEDMIPVLDRHISLVAPPSEGHLPNPHMPAKIVAGHLAVYKVLGREESLAAFAGVAAFFLRAIDNNEPADWIGSDVSHATITTSVLFLAYREQLRGTIDPMITEDHLRGIGDTYEEAQGAFSYSMGGERLVDAGSHAVTVRLSSSMAALVEGEYDLVSRAGTYAGGWRYATVGALALGHSTRLAAE